MELELTLRSSILTVRRSRGYPLEFRQYIQLSQRLFCLCEAEPVAKPILKQDFNIPPNNDISKPRPEECIIFCLSKSLSIINYFRKIIFEIKNTMPDDSKSE